MKIIIACISGLILLTGIFKRWKSYKQPTYYKSCAITAVVFSATALGFCIIDDYSLVTPVFNIISSRYGGIPIIMLLFIISAAHLNAHFMFTNRNFNFLTIIIYTFASCLAIIFIDSHSHKISYLIVITCMFFVIGVFHNFIGPLISAYSFATLAWTLYLGTYSNIPELLALWPNFFDFFSIDYKPIEYTIMVASILFGMSDYLQELPNQLA